MNLRRSLTLFIFLITLCGYAQDIKATIAKEFTDYQEAIINKEFERSLEYITPEFFEIYPKEQILKLMEDTFNNPAFAYEIKNTRIDSVGQVQEIEEKHYALLTYSNQMNIRFTSEGEESQDQEKSRLAQTRISLEQTFGSNNVKYNPATEFFEVQAQKNVYAISEDGNTNWKFLMVDKTQKPVMDQLLPSQLANKI